MEPIRKSSGQNRHACAPYTRVPPPTVEALPFQAGSVGEHPGVADEPRVPGHGRIGLPLQPGPHAGAAQVVARQVRAPQQLAALDEQDPVAGIREHARGDAAARAGADHDHVVVPCELVLRDHCRRGVGPGRPARPRRQRPEAELLPSGLRPEVGTRRKGVHGELPLEREEQELRELTRGEVVVTDEHDGPAAAPQPRPERHALDVVERDAERVEVQQQRLLGTGRLAGQGDAVDVGGAGQPRRRA